MGIPSELLNNFDVYPDLNIALYLDVKILGLYSSSYSLAIPSL